MPETKPYKALIAFVLTFLGALATSLQGRADRLGNMTAVEWFGVIIAAVVVAGGTYAIPNPPTTARRRGELGQNALYLALVVLVVLAIVFLVLGVR